MSSYHKLKVHDLSAFSAVERPRHATHLNLDSPVSEIWTDFAKNTPLMLESETSIDEANQMMRKTHVRSKLIIDADENFLGLLTFADLESRKVLAMANRMGVTRKDLTVKDVMTPKSELHGLSLDVVEHARIGDVLLTLRAEGDQHMLVVDSRTTRIRGVISASRIASELHLDMDIKSKAASFAEVFDVVYHDREILR